MQTKGLKIVAPSDAYDAVKQWSKKEQENFWTISLTCGHEIIKINHVSKGLVNKTIVHPRECYRAAIKDNAAAVIFIHNHPSGKMEPSNEDDEITEKLCMAGKIVGIHVVDHLIIGKNGYYSFRNNYKINTYKEYQKQELMVFADSVDALNEKGA